MSQKTYQFTLITLPANEEEQEKILDEYSREGWKVTSVYAGRAYLQRPLSNKPKAE